MTEGVLDSIQPFAIALLIGLCVGIERERSQDAPENVMGMRTFMLIALLGTGAAFIGQPAVTFGILLFVTLLIAIGYWRSTSGVRPEADAGLTTEFAGGLVLILGYLAKTEPFLSVSLGVVLVAILFFRKLLHSFARDVLRPQEIATVILLAAFAFVLIPFLPNKTIDPLNLVNPRQLGQVVALIAVIEFCSYIAERLVGAKVGLLATGFLGGLVSSTAVFLNMAKVAKNQPQKHKIIAGSCLLAIVSPLLLFLAIVSAASTQLLPLVAAPIFACALCAALLGIAIGRRGDLTGESAAQRRNPLDLHGVIKLGALLSGLLIASSLAQRYFGAAGIETVSFLGGLFELHGVTLANATLHAADALDDNTATTALLLAVVASFFSKLVICWTLSPGRFALFMTGLILLVVGVGGMTIVFK